MVDFKPFSFVSTALGGFIILYSVLKLLSYPLTLKANLGHSCSKFCLTAFTVVNWILILAMGVVFGVGSVHTFFTFLPEFTAGPFGFELYCQKELFFFAFATAVVIWALIAIGLLIAAVNFVFLVCFGISKDGEN